MLAASSLLAAPLVHSQSSGRLPRVGFVTGAEGPTPGTAAFVRGLENHGHVIGKTVQIEWKYAAGKAERFSEFIRELVALPADVIVASSPQATVLASRATKSIPIVMAATTDPVKLGVIASLRRPGGNVTGLTLEVTPEFFGKQVQILKETLPGLSRLGITLNPDMQGVQPMIEAAEQASVQLRIRTVRLPIRSEADLESAFATAARERVEAFLVLADPVIFGFRQKLSAEELKARLPSMNYLVDFVTAGGLMAYGPSLIEQFDRAADYVDRILKGAKPQDLPVEQPTKFELTINQKTAKAIGLTIPQSVLLRVDRVIE